MLIRVASSSDTTDSKAEEVITVGKERENLLADPSKATLEVDKIEMVHMSDSERKYQVDYL